MNEPARAPEETAPLDTEPEVAPAPSTAAPRAAPGAAKRRRRWIRRLRRLAALAVLLSPIIWEFSLELIRRGIPISRFDRPHYWGWISSVAGAALFWGLQIYVASERRARWRHGAAALFLVLFLACVGVQSAFFSIYRIYLSIDGQLYAESVLPAIVGTLPLSQPRVLGHLVLTLVVGVGFLLGARRLVRPRRIPRLVRLLFLAPVIAVVLLAHKIPVSYRAIQSTTPDLIYLNGIAVRIVDRIRKRTPSEAVLVRVQRRKPEPVPKLTAAPARPRNVLFLLQEAQRADATCSAYDPKCPEANVETNKLLPNRMGLLQMRSTASSTAIAISSLWAGVDPTESKALLHSAPLIWEYAHAAGYDTAYWTSQNLMFGNARLYVQDLPVSHFVSATNLEPQSEQLMGARDDFLSNRVIQEIGELKEPFFAVVHYSNIHYPRYLDGRRSPFKPADGRAKKGPGLRNHYKNAVYVSDAAMARLVKHVRNSKIGKSTVIVFTSDHGEALGEHGNENFHSATLYDEEIRVPAWIDAPPNTLSPEEERSIQKARTDWLWQVDFTPTFLDLLGLWDAPEIAAMRARMIGHPITRGERTTGPVPLTNVSWVWEYYLPNWGLMQGPWKIYAGPRDKQYQCYNVLLDPNESRNLGEAACAPLVTRAKALYGMMPRDLVHLDSHPEWAKR